MWSINIYRDVIGAELLESEDDKKIGGHGMTVEIGPYYFLFIFII